MGVTPFCTTMASGATISEIIPAKMWVYVSKFIVVGLRVAGYEVWALELKDMIHEVAKIK